MENKALIRNAVALGNGKHRLEPPYSYEAVAALLEWMAAELRKTKEDVVALPKMNARSEDDYGDTAGLGIYVEVERGNNYEKRLKQINANQ